MKPYKIKFAFLLGTIICLNGCRIDDSLAVLSEGKYVIQYSNPQILSNHDDLDTNFWHAPESYYLLKSAENSFNFHYYTNSSNGLKILPCVIGNVTTSNTTITFTKLLPIGLNNSEDSCFINLQNDTGSITVLESKFNRAGEIVGTCNAYLLFKNLPNDYKFYKCKANFVLRKLGN